MVLIAMAIDPTSIVSGISNAVGLMAKIPALLPDVYWTRHSPLIPLKKAALISYEQTRQADHYSFPTNPARDRLYHHVIIIFTDAYENDEIIFGRHVPSRKHEPVPREEYRSMSIAHDGSNIKNVAEAIEWDDPAITYLHLRRCIKRQRLTIAQRTR